MKFILRAQELGKKAAELGKAVQGLPAKAAQVREAVTMTGGELKQLRTDVQTSLHSLRADSEERLLASMREINDHAQIFREAGYDLEGLDLDLALNQRLAVHLDKFEEVPHSQLRSLLSRQTTETIRSIVTGILKAEETAANVELSHLMYCGLVIHIGSIPMIRMLWRNAMPQPGEQPVTPAISAAPLPSVPVPPASSMFDLRPLPGAAIQGGAQDAPATAITPTLAHSQPAAPASSAWSHDALARFKTMPGVSKYKR